MNSAIMLWVVVLICMIFGFFSEIYTVSQCGFWQTFNLDTYTFFAAGTGICK